MQVLKSKTLVLVLSVILIISIGVFAGVFVCKQKGNTTQQEISQNATNTSRSSDNLWEYDTTADGIRIVAYLGSQQEITIPSNINGQRVVTIGDGSLYYDSGSSNNYRSGFFRSVSGSSTIENSSSRTRVTKVTIPDSVMTISASCFYNCTALASVYIGSGMKTIGDNAFVGCPITNVHLTGDSDVANWCNIAFSDEDSNPLYNGASLWLNISGEDTIVTTLMIPNIQTISAYAFYGAKLIDTVDMNQSVTKIGTDAFRNCSSIKTVNMHSLPAWCAIEFVNEYSNPLCISGSSGSNKELRINGLDLTGSLTVGKNDGVTSISTYAFYNWKRLTTLNIGTSLVKISDHAFKGCTNLANLSTDAGGTYSEFANIAGYGDSNVLYTGVSSSSTLAFYPEGKTDQTFTIPSGCSKIATHAFYGVTNLRTLIASPGLTVLESEACAYSSIQTFRVDDSNTRLTTIGESAFVNCSNLSSVTIRGRQVSIGSNAFSSLTQLTNLDMDDNIAQVGANAFSGCSGLTSLYIGINVTKIGNGAFSGCTNITSLTFNARQCEDFALGNRVFHNLGSGKDGVDLIIGANVQRIPAYFTCAEGQRYIGYSYYGGSSSYNTSGLNEPRRNSYVSEEIHYHDVNLKVKTLAFESSGVCTTIGKYAFANNNYLTSVTLADTVTTLEEGAFYWCRKLTSISTKALTIGQKAFYNCPLLATATLTNVREIGSNCFYNDTALSAVSLPIVVTIDDYAFYNCTSLDNISLNSTSLKTVGAYAFNKCNNLQTITLTSATTLGNYAFAECVNLKTANLPASLTSIGNYIFYNCTKLDTVNLAEGLTLLGAYMFKGCTTLQQIDIPESVNQMGSYVFSGCTGLESIDIPGTITSINSYSFENCSSLATITLHEGTKTIGTSAFTGCNNADLETIILPDTIETVDSYAFSGCAGVKTLTIGTNVKTIGNYAFNNCTGLTTINYNATSCNDLSNYNYSTSDGNRAFYKAGSSDSGITLYIGENVTKIPSYLFYSINNSSDGNAKITSLVWEGTSSCTSIGNYAFAYVGSLTSLVLPASLTTIYGYAFYNCTALTGSITFPTKTANINSYAFANCTSLQHLIFDELGDSDIKTFGEGVFANDTNLNSVSVAQLIDWSKMNFNVTSDTSNPFFYASWLKVKDETDPNTYNALQTLEIGADDNGEQYIKLIKNLYAIESIRAVIVDEANTTFSAVDNVIFSKDGETLYIYPAGKSDVTYEIPEGVKYISARAFYQNASLRNITIPTTITNIYRRAFKYCKDLRRIDFKPTNCAYEYSVSTDICFYPEAVETFKTTLYIYPNVTTIPAHMFESAKNIDALIFVTRTLAELAENPDLSATDCTTLGSYAFAYCSNLYKGVGTGADADPITLPGSITTMGEYIFYQCARLTQIMLSENLSCAIGSRSFAGCTALQSIEIPDLVTGVNSCAFQDCTALQTVVVGDGATIIGECAFSRCSELRTVILGDSVATIDRWAFEKCSKLQTLTLGTGIREIKDRAFVGCQSVNFTRINIPDIATWCNITFTRVHDIYPTGPYSDSASSSWNFGHSTNSCTDESHYTYSNPLYYAKNLYVNGTLVTTLVIPETVTQIKNYAFVNSSVTSLMSQGTIETIGARAFYGNKSFVTIDIDAKQIGSMAFYQITNLVTASLGDNATNIGDSAFYGCTNLRSVTFGQKLSVVGSTAFYNCTSLEELCFEKDVIINSQAFYGCTGLIRVAIQGKNSQLYSQAFYGCTSLVEVELLISLEKLSVDLTNSGAYNSLGCYIQYLSSSQGYQQYSSQAFYGGNSSCVYKFRDQECIDEVKEKLKAIMTVNISGAQTKLREGDLYQVFSSSNFEICVYNINIDFFESATNNIGSGDYAGQRLFTKHVDEDLLLSVEIINNWDFVGWYSSRTDDRSIVSSSLDLDVTKNKNATFYILYEEQTPDIVIGDLFKSDGVVNLHNAKELFQNITTENPTNEVSTDLEYIPSEGGKNVRRVYRNGAYSSILVTIGGLQWYLTYLTTDTDGNKVATLWLKDYNDVNIRPAERTSEWNKVSNRNSTIQQGYMPADMYSTSYIRAVTLNNANYYADYTTIGTDGLALQYNTQSVNNTYARFTMKKLSSNIIDFLVQPKKIRYQENESAKDNAEMSTVLNYNLNNESWKNGGSFPEANYANETTNNIGTSYDDWANDYIWLPSLTEIYKQVGYWGINSRELGVNDFWLRSAKITVDSDTNLSYASVLHTQARDMLRGKITTETNLTTTYGVRPAIHLNLTKLHEFLTPTMLLETEKGLGGDTIVTVDQPDGQPGQEPEPIEIRDVEVPDREGYIFSGYYSEENGQGDQFYDSNGEAVITDLDDNHKIYAYWVPVQFELTFDANGGTLDIEKENYNYGQTYELPIPERKGYQFNGWYTNIEGETNTNVYYGRDYLYEDKVSIHFSAYMRNWKLIASRNLNLLSCATGGGWKVGTNNDGFIVYSAYNIDGENRVALSTKKWEEVMYGWHTFDLIFDGVNITGYMDGEIIAKTSGLIPSDIGYIGGVQDGIYFGDIEVAGDEGGFVGYIGNISIKNTDSLNETKLFTIPAQDIKLYANWSLRTYTITLNYQENFGQATGGGDYKFGEQAILTATPMEGYRFDGWEKDGEIFTKDKKLKFTVSDDETYNAVFSRIEEPINTFLIAGVVIVLFGAVVGAFLLFPKERVT